MKLHSIRFKVSVLYTLVLGAILLVYSLFLYFNLSYVVFHEIDRDLKKKATEIQNTIYRYSEAFQSHEEAGAISLRRALHLEQQESSEFFQWPSIKRLDHAWRSTIQVLGIRQDYIVVFTHLGEVVEKSYNVDQALLAELSKSFPITAVKTSINNIMVNNRQLRVITRPLYLSGRIQYIIQLATPTESRHFLLKNKMKVIMISIPIFLLGTSFLGAFFVHRVFKPVKEVTETARGFTHKDLSQRVALQHEDEEIKSLVNAFNEMLTSLETSFRHIEEFSSNVAHELKTPLAIIQGELEVTLRKKRTAEEYREAIEVAISESRKLQKTVNDLLFLAKLDYKTEMINLLPLELNKFMQNIYDKRHPLAREKNIAMNLQTTDMPLVVAADPPHLERLFFNLIDNAIKYTPANGRIDITLAPQGGMLQVEIRDSGIGIKPENLPKIFDRFFYANNGTAPSIASGLGLSIAQTIAKIHNGHIRASSQVGQGSVFTVFLPLVYG